MIGRARFNSKCGQADRFESQCPEASARQYKRILDTRQRGLQVTCPDLRFRENNLPRDVPKSVLPLKRNLVWLHYLSSKEPNAGHAPADPVGGEQGRL